MENTLLYFNSALAQSMAALFGVLGVFYVFRLQAVDLKLRQLYDSAKEFFWGRQKDWPKANTAKMWLDKDILSYIASARKSRPDWVLSLDDYKIHINAQLTKKKELQDSIMFPLKMIGCIFMVTVIALPLSNVLSKLWVVKWLFIFVVLFLCWRLVSEAYKFVLIALKDPEDVIINSPGVKEQ